MATFDKKKTGTNITSWAYYIEGKDDWKRFEDLLKVETKNKNLPVLYKNTKGKETVGGPLKNGTKLKLLSSKSFEIDKKIHAYVNVKGIKGFLPISVLGKPSKDTTKDEKIALGKLDLEIKEKTLGKKEGLCLIVKNESNTVEFVFEDCIAAKNVTGTPKADFTVNSKKGPELFISHKKAGGPSAFQQYVSITGKNRDGINDHPIVQRALMRFAGQLEKIVQDRKRFKVRIPWTSQGKDLIMKAIYGPDYGKKFGTEHVHLIGQGDPILAAVLPKDKPKKKGMVYELKFSDGMSLSGEISHFKKKGFVPIMWLRYSADRKVYVEGIEFIGVRAFISPEAHAGGSAKEIPL